MSENFGKINNGIDQKKPDQKKLSLLDKIKASFKEKFGKKLENVEKASEATNDVITDAADNGIANTVETPEIQEENVLEEKIEQVSEAVEKDNGVDDLLTKYQTLVVEEGDMNKKSENLRSLIDDLKQIDNITEDQYVSLAETHSSIIYQAGKIEDFQEKVSQKERVRILKKYIDKGMFEDGRYDIKDYFKLYKVTEEEIKEKDI